jgi:hypothetical protein
VAIELPLDTMTTSEKLLTLEAIWASLCSKPSEVNSPAWHEEILAERRRRLETGEATVSDWASAKMRIQKFGVASR